MKIQKRALTGALSFLSILILSPAIAAELPTCTQLPSVSPLAGNPAVVSAAATEMTTADGIPYCRVDVTWSTPGLSGPSAGYAEGESQSVKIAIALPETADWTGRLIMTAGGGSQGTLPDVVGGAADSYTAKIAIGAIGAGTDSGHGPGSDFGVIQATHTLDYGKIADWAGGRANGIAVKLAKQLALTYYGMPVAFTYWQGRSGGGHMGLAQVQNFPEEYDGALIGAPANHWQKFRLADSWDEIVRKKVAQQTTPISQDQMNAANEAATESCDGDDGVNDNIVADPRACTWSATNNICGVEGAPLPPYCLNEIQAAGIDRIWDGPRNSKGERIWHPYDRGINLGVGTNTQGSTTQVMQWNHADLTFDRNNLYADQESIDLAAAAGVDVTNAITYEDEATLGSHTTNDFTDTDDRKLDGAFNRGMKIIQYQGTQDQAIQFRNSLDYYRRVATYFGHGHADFESLQEWYRFFLIPNAPHQANPPNGLSALIDWVENGVAPDSLASPTAVPKLCPFPRRAIYLGGPANDPNSYTCGGNLDENLTALCQMPRVKPKHELGSALNTNETKIPPGQCEALEQSRKK